MNYLAIAALVGALGAGFAGGHYVASNKAVAAQAVAVKSAEDKFDKERKDLNRSIENLRTERDGYINERVAISQKAAEDLQKQRAESEAREAKLRRSYLDAERAYKQRIKELEDARKKLDDLIDTNTPDGGLWINVAPGSCATPTPASSSGNQHGNDVSKASVRADRLVGTLRCRIADPDAKALVKISEISDQRTTLLNKCIGILNKTAEELTAHKSEAAQSGGKTPKDSGVDSVTKP